MKLKGRHTTYYDVEVSPKEALRELERLLLKQAGIQSDVNKHYYHPYINKQGQLVEYYRGCRGEIETRVLADTPTKRQLALIQAFETLKYEIRGLE